MQTIAAQIQANSKLVVLKSVLRGERRSLENRYKLDVSNFLFQWYREVRRTMLRNRLFGQIDQVAPQIRALPKAEQELAIRDFMDDIFAIVAEDVLDSPLRAKLVTILTNHNRKLFALGGATALQSMGFPAIAKFSRMKAAEPLVFELTDEEVLGQLDGAAIAHGRGITADTIKDARAIIREVVFGAGESAFEAGEVLRDTAGIVSYRAERIALTEAQSAFSSAQYETYRRSGVGGKSWLTVGDHKVRTEHTRNERQGIIPMNATFSSAQLHPGDPGPRVLHVHCRCSLLPDLSDLDIVLEPWTGGP